MAAPMESSMERQNVETCEIEATLPTGFEAMAKEEVEEKLGVSAHFERGKVNFDVSLDEVTKILDLCSVDNLFVVIKHYHQFEFAKNLDEALKQIMAIVPEADWDLGLRVWAKFSSYPHQVSSLPQLNKGVNDHDKTEVEQDAPKKRKDNDIEVPTKKEQSDSSKVEHMPEDNAKEVNVPEATLPSFRATCYRSGGKHIFQSPQAASNFGGAVQDYFGWNVNLTKFDIEVVLTVESKHMYVGIALTRESMHRRHLVEFGPTTLRPTIAYNMLRLCKIKTGDTVIDPMCGGGSIPIEASLNWNNCHHMCGDIHHLAVPRTLSNCKAISEDYIQKGWKPLNLDIFRWDVTRLPIKDESVDVVITDLPFGKRSGSRQHNWNLYPRALREMARICRPDSGRACILTQDKKCFTDTMKKVSGLWRRGLVLGINIGGLSACVFMLYRTSRPYHQPAGSGDAGHTGREPNAPRAEATDGNSGVASTTQADPQD